MHPVMHYAYGRYKPVLYVWIDLDYIKDLQIVCVHSKIYINTQKLIVIHEIQRAGFTCDPHTYVQV